MRLAQEIIRLTWFGVVLQGQHLKVFREHSPLLSPPIKLIKNLHELVFKLKAKKSVPINQKKLAGVILFFALLNHSCSSVIVKKNAVRAISVTQNFPIINNTGKLLGYDTSEHVNIYFYNNQVLYRDYYKWDSIVDNVLLKSEIRQSYFVFTKNASYGYFFDHGNTKSGMRVLVDSLLKSKWFSQNSFTNVSFRKVSDKFIADSGILSRIFITKGITDTSMCGTTLLFYTNKLAWVDYSMMREADTIKNMKLFKIRSKTNSRYLKEYNITLDTIEQAFDMKEIPVIDEKEILYYFEREKMQQ